MKLRSGFVSNSSSTSFTCLTTKENHAKVLASFSDSEREAFGIFARLSLTERTFCGVPVVVASYVSGECGDDLHRRLSQHLESQELINVDDVWHAVSRWKVNVLKDSNNTFIHTQTF